MKLTSDEAGYRQEISASLDGSVIAAARLFKPKTGLEDIMTWVGAKGHGPRLDPNIVLISPGGAPASKAK